MGQIEAHQWLVEACRERDLAMSGSKPSAGPERPQEETQEVPALYKESGFFGHGPMPVCKEWRERYRWPLAQGHNCGWSLAQVCLGQLNGISKGSI